jgi:hypothetical protein
VTGRRSIPFMVLHRLAGAQACAAGDAQAALYLRRGPGAASRRRPTSCALSTRGSSRG